jgi:hypothetical protein
MGGVQMVRSKKTGLGFQMLRNKRTRLGFPERRKKKKKPKTKQNDEELRNSFICQNCNQYPIRLK